HTHTFALPLHDALPILPRGREEARPHRQPVPGHARPAIVITHARRNEARRRAGPRSCAHAPARYSRSYRVLRMPATEYAWRTARSEEHTSELQSRENLV